jgi:hypothetical protein
VKLRLTAPQRPLFEEARVGIRAGRETMVSIGSTEMKKVLFVAAAAGLMSLAACTPAANNTADANAVDANAAEYDATATNEVDANAVTADANATAPVVDANAAAPAENAAH